MSELLDTGLNRNSLDALAQLCDEGINPYILSHGAIIPIIGKNLNSSVTVVRELQREKEALDRQQGKQ